jgi:preprotein translocase subunit SecG
MDITSSAKNLGSSAFGSSSSGSGGGGDSAGGGDGMFSGFMNLSIQKMVLLLAIIAFIISVGTVAILLWKSKSSQKWPPEISKCPDRMDLSGNVCVDKYGLVGGNNEVIPGATNCASFEAIRNSRYTAPGLSGEETGYIPWEGIVDGQKSRASSLKCAT